MRLVHPRFPAHRLLRLLLATPIAAAGPTLVLAEEVPQASTKEEWRIVVQVEEWWSAPRNLDLDYAFVQSGSPLSGGGEVVTLSAAHQGEPRVRVAWRSGAEGLPAAGASFWEFDAEISSETGNRPAMVGALLASPDFAIGRSLVDFAQARSRVRGTLVDADLSWRHDRGGRTRLGFSAGLRLFRFEQQTTVTYGAVRTSDGAVLREFVTSSTDARGIGPRGGVSFGYAFGRRVVVGGEVGLALPVGEVEGEVTDSAFIDSTFDRATVVTRPGSRRAFAQFDGALRVEVTLTGRLAATASYLYSEWPGVALTQRFVDDVSQNTTLPIEEDVVFEGVTVGLRFEF